jgi:hypothetical protein
MLMNSTSALEGQHDYIRSVGYDSTNDIGVDFPHERMKRRSLASPPRRKEQGKIIHFYLLPSLRYVSIAFLT